MALTGHNPPYWTKRTPDRPSYLAMPGEVDVDVVVMGGGIAGLTAAALLYEAGKRVALIEMNEIAGGTTGHSTGHMDTSSDQDFQTLGKDWGEEAVLNYVNAKYAAIDTIERIDRDYGLKADVVRYDGYVYAEPDQDVRSMAKELEWAKRLHLPYPEAKPELPFPVALGMLLPRNGRVDPLAYTVNLAKALTVRGVEIYEQTRMEDVVDYGERVVVTTNRGSIIADRAILMGHAPVQGPGVVDSRTRPHQSYVIAVRVEERIPDASYYDMEEPYHYIRWASSDEPDVLLIGGADHGTGMHTDTMKSFLDLEDYARKRFKVREITHRWSHEYWDSADGMPFIGRGPGKNNVFFATGFAGEGITFGVFSATLLVDLALGKENELAEQFSPARGKLGAGAFEIAKAGVEAVKGLVVDRIKPDVSSVDEIAAGQGAVVRIEGQELAVYRSEGGELKAVSPVCRHQGCIVHWNSAEKTWDCPCHGARYAADGKVLMGPARSDLPEQPLPASVRA